jgi:predicted DNA-binding transcriptional regulator YafY
MILNESTRVERVTALTRLLIVRREITAADAAHEFGVSKRTIQRDLTEMSRVLAIRSDNGLWIYEGDPDLISPY